MPPEEKKNPNDISIRTVQQMIDYIEDNILEQLTPNGIAEQFFLSVSTLNILFKTVCGMTIMEYIRNRRLTLAGKELMFSNIHIIDLAYKYGYETPEAFTKAFTRFHGFPPSYVRRTYVKTEEFFPLTIKLEIEGGWANRSGNNSQPILPKQNSPQQEQSLFSCYDKATKYKGGTPMEKHSYEYHIHLKDMQQKDDWRILLSLAEKLKQANIRFKVDGKTMIFAHGLEFKLEKICLTFSWNEEQKVKDFFHFTGSSKSSFTGFKFFDAVFEDRKVRCMFYGNCPGDDTEDFLFRNTEPVDIDGQIIHVQTLEFYYQNAEPKDEYYNMVEQWLSRITL